MNTVALLLRARIALPCSCVLAGRIPLASLVMMDLGRLRSYNKGGRSLARILPQRIFISQNSKAIHTSVNLQPFSASVEDCLDIKNHTASWKLKR